MYTYQFGFCWYKSEYCWAFLIAFIRSMFCVNCRFNNDSGITQSVLPSHKCHVCSLIISLRNGHDLANPSRTIATNVDIMRLKWRFYSTRIFRLKSNLWSNILVGMIYSMIVDAQITFWGSMNMIYGYIQIHTAVGLSLLFSYGRDETKWYITVYNIFIRLCLYILSTCALITTPKLEFRSRSNTIFYTWPVWWVTGMVQRWSCEY